MSRLITLDHGNDTSEEIIDLDEIIFTRALLQPKGKKIGCSICSPLYDVKVYIEFSNGNSTEIGLTRESYRKFVKKLMEATKKEMR